MTPFLPCHEKTFSTTQFCRTCSCCYRRAAPDAKTSLAYTTGPFSAPHCPARPSRTTEGLILYGAVAGLCPGKVGKRLPEGVAQAARRSGSEFAKRMSSGDARRRYRRSPRTRTPLNGLTKKSASADRPGPGFRTAKSERPLRAQGFGDVPGTRTPPNGLTKKSASADRHGRGTLQRKVGKRLERRRGSGMCPVKKEASPFWASLLVRNRLQELFLASLVSLVEHINSAGAVDDLHLAGVERVRCV